MLIIIMKVGYFGISKLMANLIIIMTMTEDDYKVDDNYDFEGGGLWHLEDDGHRSRRSSHSSWNTLLHQP